MDEGKKELEGQLSSEATPKLLVLSKELFAPGTVGREIFPGELTGRERPTGFLKTPLEDLKEYSIDRGSLRANIILVAKQRQILEKGGFHTLEDILNATPQELEEATSRISAESVKAKIQETVFEHYLAVGPLGLLLGSVYAADPAPLSLSADIKRGEAAAQILQRLKKISPKRHRILTLTFGLEDGVLKNFHVVGEIVGISNSGANQMARAAQRDIRRLDHPDHQLMRLTAFSRGNPLREIWGATCVDDLEKMYPKVDFDRSKIDDLKKEFVDPKVADGYFFNRRNDSLTKWFLKLGRILPIYEKYENEIIEKLLAAIPPDKAEPIS